MLGVGFIDGQYGREQAMVSGTIPGQVDLGSIRKLSERKHVCNPSSICYAFCSIFLPWIPALTLVTDLPQWWTIRGSGSDKNLFLLEFLVAVIMSYHSNRRWTRIAGAQSPTGTGPLLSFMSFQLHRCAEMQCPQSAPASVLSLLLTSSIILPCATLLAPPSFCQSSWWLFPLITLLKWPFRFPNPPPCVHSPSLGIHECLSVCKGVCLYVFVPLVSHIYHF